MKQGLKMVRGTGSNQASCEVRGLDPRRVYVTSAWVHADQPGRRASLRIRTPVGKVLAASQTVRAGRGTQWNEWSRMTLTFTPEGSTACIELHDTQAAEGTVLYWDFIELESAWPLE